MRLCQEQRQRKGPTTTCDLCGRMICKNEYYWVKVLLFVGCDNVREVHVTRSCCKELQ